MRTSPHQSSKYDLNKAIDYIFKKPLRNKSQLKHIIKKRSPSPEDAKPKRVSQSQLVRHRNQAAKVSKTYNNGQDISQLKKAFIFKNPKQSQPTLSKSFVGKESQTKGGRSSMITSGSTKNKSGTTADYFSEFYSVDMKKPKIRSFGATSTGPVCYRAPRSKTRQYFN